MREVGLKCISFNGIPRTINCLGAFRAGVAGEAWAAGLARRPAARRLTARNADAVAARGRALWRSVYTPFDDKLEHKLALAHPDLPLHILSCHYGPLLADPDSRDMSGEGEAEAEEAQPPPPPGTRVGRNLTSVAAIACLRAQTGVGPQVLSHVFGLRKGVEQGLHRDEFAGLEGEADGVERLAGDEGCEWLLRSVDEIAGAIGRSFANWEGEGLRESKL